MTSLLAVSCARTIFWRWVSIASKLKRFSILFVGMYQCDGGRVVDPFSVEQTDQGYRVDGQAFHGRIEKVFHGMCDVVSFWTSRFHRDLTLLAFTARTVHTGANGMTVAPYSAAAKWSNQHWLECSMLQCPSIVFVLMNELNGEVYNLVKLMGSCEVGVKTQIIVSKKLDDTGSKGFIKG
jgi:hypothetical protein